MMLMFLFLRMGSIFIVENRFFSGFVVGFESKPNLKFGFFFGFPFIICLICMILDAADVAPFRG